MDIDLELQLPKVPRAVRVARHVIDGFADQLEEEVVERFRLVVSELVTNSVRHAPRPNRRMKILVHVNESVIRVEVIDGWRGFDVPEQPLVEWASGWGLFLVDQLTDRWGTNASVGRGVWCEFDLTARRAGTQSGGPGDSTAMLRMNVS